MEADDRCLAETHYQLGVAYSFSDDFDKSIASFSKALKIIEDRVTNLEVTSPTKGSKKTPSKSPGKDAKDKINKVKKELGMASAIGGNVESSSNGFGPSSTSSEAKTIETKKRKPDDKVEDASKKSKAENGAKNGNSSP